MKMKQTLFASGSTILSFSTLFALTSSSFGSALFTEGHGDVAVGFHDGEFEFGYHLGEDQDTAVVDGVVVNDAEFEASEIIVQVTEQLEVSAGADPSLLTGTGATPGSTVFQISQFASGVGSPILGLGTEELEQPTGVSWSDVSYTLNSVTGPGFFSLFLNDSGTFNFALSQADSVLNFTFPAGAHEEYNWVFTEAGTYELNLTASATRTDMTGATPYSATETFTFNVVPEPSSALLLAGSTLGLLLRRRR